MNAPRPRQAAAADRAAAVAVTVWDPLVRIFHWALVAAFFTAFLSAEDAATLHEWAGWVALGLIGFRLFWGLVGTRHARFADFVPSPGGLLAYLRDFLRGTARRYIGHTPAGGAMIVALLLAVGATALTGAAMTTGWGWGNRAIQEAHEAMANLTLVLIAGHVAGVLAMSLLHRENLVRAMLTGRKRAGP